MSLTLLWFHLLGIIISLGGGLGLVLSVYPSLYKIDDRAERMKRLEDTLRYFHPLFLFGICLTFMTGAFGLTNFKIMLGESYFETMSSILYWKFGLTTLIFLFASGQCFGMGLKFGRMVYGVIEGTIEQQEKLARRIRNSTIINIILLGITLYIGLQMP